MQGGSSGDGKLIGYPVMKTTAKTEKTQSGYFIKVRIKLSSLNQIT